MAASVLDSIVSLAKRRGFVFPSGEIYGGTRSAWDYGPLGVELKENIKRQWWRAMVHAAATTSSALTRRSSCRARSGWRPATSAVFNDPLVENTVTHKRYRADHLHGGLRGQARPPPATAGTRSPTRRRVSAATGPSRATST